MCGIIGYSCPNPNKEHFDILQSLIYQSKIRGLHSFGLSYYENGLITKKYHSIEQVELPITNKIIYHNRYSTSGDYKEHKNNQPIALEDISLVFNGVLDMRKKQEIEHHYKIKMNNDNDGEIILRLCNSDKKLIQDFVSKTKGSFAGMFLTKDNVLYAIRNNNRPLWMLKNNDATFYASTKDIFKRVNNLFEPKELMANKIYES
jgi:glutamine phosphoribosylpyrophosphate amidotransferase